MNLSNPFPLEVRNLFLYVYACFQCGRSDRGLELHHVFGRISGSALNACPLCTDCHKVITHTIAEEHKLFRITLNFHIREHYKLVERDNIFLDCVKDRLQGFVL